MQVLFLKKKKKGSLLLKTFMLQDLPRTATVSRPCELNGLVYHHFQFYATGLLHTIGPLIILVSMRAGGEKKRLSVQECKFLSKSISFQTGLIEGCTVAFMMLLYKKKTMSFT